VNKYKIWQIILIYSVLVFGVIFALPNFFPTKPAIQIAFGDSARVLNTNIVADITRELDSKNIQFVEIEQSDNSAKVIFNDVESQLAGRRILANYSDGEFIIALKFRTLNTRLAELYWWQTNQSRS